MPQIEKFGYASATTTVTSAPGSSSRARSAALIPASLPPIISRCMAGSRHGWLGGGLARARPRGGGAIMSCLGGRGPGLVILVGDDDLGGLGGRDGRIQRLDDHQGQQPADDLGGNERRHGGGGDTGEGVRKHPADGDRRVG